MLLRTRLPDASVVRWDGMIPVMNGEGCLQEGWVRDPTRGDDVDQCLIYLIMG